MNNSLQPGSRNSNGPLYFASRIRAISGQVCSSAAGVGAGPLHVGSGYDCAPSSCVGSTRSLPARCPQTVTLERAVPLTIRSAMQPSLVRRAPTLTHVGLEGFTMHFKHTTYLVRLVCLHVVLRATAAGTHCQLLPRPPAALPPATSCLRRATTTSWA